MKKTPSQVAGRDAIEKVLQDFYRFEIKQHKKDGVDAIAALEKSFEEVKKLSEWGRLVLVPQGLSGKREQKHTAYVAAGFQFLVLCVLFQEWESLVISPGQKLSIGHFPRDKQEHAQKSVNLVLGDMALALMHNLLLKMPTDSKTIIHYEGVFAGITKEIFSQALLTAKKPTNDIMGELFLQGLRLGINTAALPKKEAEVILKTAHLFWKQNKRESFVDPLLNELSITSAN